MPLARGSDTVDSFPAIASDGGGGGIDDSGDATGDGGDGGSGDGHEAQRADWAGGGEGRLLQKKRGKSRLSNSSRRVRKDAAAQTGFSPRRGLVLSRL